MMVRDGARVGVQVDVGDGNGGGGSGIAAGGAGGGAGAWPHGGTRESTTTWPILAAATKPCRG
jgi:hypothetical protein